MVERANIGGNTAVTGEPETGGVTLLSEVGTPGRKNRHYVYFIEVSEGLLELEGKDSGNIELQNDCTTKLAGYCSPDCKPEEPIEASVKSLIVLHPTAVLQTEMKETITNPEGYVLFSPASGTTFITIEFLAPCALPAGINVKGTAVVKDCNGLFRTEGATHLIEEVGAGLFPLDGLKFGANPASLDGSAVLKLVGGGNWSGLPA